MVNPGHASKCCVSWRVCLGFGEKQANRQISESHISTSSGDDNEYRAIETSVKSALSIEVLLTSEKYPNNSLDSAAPRGSDEVSIHVIDTIRKCLRSLHQPLQSLEKRRALLAEYGAATNKLRTTLAVSPHSLALGRSVLLFSIYEMIVNIDLADQTWQLHLEGLLIILSQLPHNPHSTSSLEDIGTLHAAIQISKSKGYAFQKLTTYEANSLEKAFLILDVAMLCLRLLVLDCEGLLQRVPRKIDVQKLRASVKQIQKNLNLFSKICPVAESDSVNHSSRDELVNALLLIRWNDYHCLQLITADLLSSTGTFVSSEGYKETREYHILSSTINEAREGICSAVPVILETEPAWMISQSQEPIKKPTRGLFVLWHLCCAIKGSNISQPRHNWIRESLWSIGGQAFIPLASALANSKTRNVKWADVLAGLLLIRVALSKDFLELFSQTISSDCTDQDTDH
ncbi:hypothetical protein N7478_007395 [Penicillium angulare]|uniref:uncharacterized protein n=1 Tax=Penicillium angulare TaxID=116970 RepID=UPI00253F88C3|nr:uncharacterized protein N7478_007395 [Penicillium angulare]KAJ5272270.1 hypothetical protein N7478_007395 [Penicillium angulare]